MAKERRPLHRGEPEAILRKAKTTRDKAMVVLLWRGGLRATESCMVRVQDFEWTRDGGLRLHIVFGKGGHQRWTGFGPKYAKILKSHIGGRRSGWYLATRTGAALNRRHVNRACKRMGEGALIKGRFNPHAFRHSFARDLHDEGYSVLEIQKALGHKHLNTTQIYLESLGIEAIVNKLTLRE